MNVTLLVVVVSLGLVVASERGGWIPAKAEVEQQKWSSQQTTTTVVDLLLDTQDLSNVSAGMKKADLDALLGNKRKKYTIFAPSDKALQDVLVNLQLTCVHKFYSAYPCSSLADLYSSTNLQKLLLNFVVEGVFQAKDFFDGELLHFAGDSVQQVCKKNGHVYIGNARVVSADLKAGNGVVHIVNNVLGSIDPLTMRPSDVSNNASAVLSATRLTDADIFNATEREEMANGVVNIDIPGFQANRDLVAYPDGGLYNHMVLTFDPSPNTKHFCKPDEQFQYPVLENVMRPQSDEDLAYMTVLQLGALIRSKQVTSLELVRLYIERLKRVDNVLQAVVTYTEELAHEQALAADALLANGKYLGPLHGIPYGLKDIIAVPGYKTTWGSKSFKDQVIDEEAGVYQKLKAAGAVLIAKLSAGALAWDDIWFGGRTKNPWNIAEGSTGSSAGSGASTSAGNVPFALGSETAGSLTYPAARCGVTALRPSFGIVGRSWVMSLSESMDKLGTFCRSAADCAIILDTIRGKDSNDWSSKDIHLPDPYSIDVTKLTVGYLSDADMGMVKVLSEKGVKMVPMELKYSVTSAQFILNVTMDVDTLAHFDHWQRARLDHVYEDQTAWPIELRRARLIPAVDYVQAQRARGKLVREIEDIFESQKVDAFIGNATDWEKVCLGNVVGMPVMVVPTGLKEIENHPPGGTWRRTTITTGIYAAPYQDATVLALAMAYQSVTDHHLQRPPVNDLSPRNVCLLQRQRLSRSVNGENRPLDTNELVAFEN